MTLEAIIPGLVAMFPIVMAIIFYGGRLVNLARDANRDVSEARTDIAEMKPKVAKIETLVQAMSDGDRRMTRLEDDQRDLRKMLENRRA